MESPLVSVCIVTYQHGAYIRQAIEGALLQRLDPACEILIGEDGSTDGTRETCLELAARHPDRIRVFSRDRSDVVLIDGRPRGGGNFRKTLWEARGEFIALCEGDDYWTDPDKLRLQVEYLRANPDCVGCFHDARVVNPSGATIAESYFQSEQEKFSRSDVLGSLLSRQHTGSMLFRAAAFPRDLPAWYLRRPSDLYLDILLTAQGSLGFIRRTMSAYRIHSGGLWSGQREAGRIVELIVRYKLLLADEYFLKHYRDLLLRKVDEFEALLFTRADAGEEISRLERTTQEQLAAIAATQAECRRLEEREREMAREVAQTRASAQGHIDQIKLQLEALTAVNQQRLDALLDQVKELSATTEEQKRLIRVLEGERDRLNREANEARELLARARSDAQRHLDQLLAQVKGLSATTEEQKQLLEVLERERERLAGEAADAQAQAAKARAEAQQHIDALLVQVRDVAKSGEEQAKLIAMLERERERLTAESAATLAGEAEARRNAQAHIDELLRQLDALAQVSKEQGRHIATIERECARLSAEEHKMRTDAAHYATVMEEQLRYIRLLEAARDRALSPSA